ncbi:HxsD-like protein [Anaeromicropila herbilytica]|uniref:Uncharacterized protein n=1 Tax=Anaeromicropila herbilytica TaxID=2785025 RepID=A0A7R7EM05_9FIRM|nr:HxsD-like protein [Anaeromicropila herbilytica]BCN31081.1 hypothetical protein bsdtb5_23760 [Anaeromicropila herbilytica]
MSKLLLTKEIFDYQVLKRAQRDFKDIANITIVDSLEYWELFFKDCQADEKVVLAEYENYVIDMLNQKELKEF